MKRNNVFFILVTVCLLSFPIVSSNSTSAQEKTGAKQQAKLNIKKIRVNGMMLHYIDRGKGDPVVFVHGTLGDYRTWNFQMDGFSKNHRVISYSRRYHYPNKWLGDLADFSVLPHAKDLAAFIKALKLGPVHLVGHSYGAFIALLTAIDHPELIRSLTLGEPPVMPLLKNTPEGDSLLTLFITKTIVPSGQAFQSGNIEQGVKTFVNGVLGDSSYEKFPPVVHQHMMDNARELKGETATRDLFPPFTCEDAQKVKAPTLLLVGERSPKIFHLITDELERCLPQKERATIPNASHGLEFENPDAFNKVVLDFIARH